MAKFLYKEIHEQGTTAFTVIFKDENDRVIIPKTSNFQLMKLDRTIIGERTFANGAFTGNKVILSGNDLSIFGDDDTRFRIFAVRGTYDSTYGNDLPCNCEVEFTITRVLNIDDRNANDENLGGKIIILKSTQNNLDGKTHIINSDLEFIDDFGGKIIITI